MAAVENTSLSAGALVHRLLLEDPFVTSVTSKVIPVATPETELPYILYGRLSLEANPAKSRPACDTVEIEVDCYAGQYGQGIELAEAVRATLDYCQAEDDTTGLRMRSCILVDASEDFDGDAYVQRLIFSMKITNTK